MPTVSDWHAAIRDNRCDEIKQLLAVGFDPNEVIGQETPPLCLAAMFGRYDAAKVLLDAGADVNRTIQLPENPQPGYRYSLESPLILAAGSGNGKLVALLVEHGADLTYCSPIRHSAAWNAVDSADSRSYAEVLRILLDHGADPLRTPSDRLLLSRVSTNKHAAWAVEVLVGRGADPNLIDEQWEAAPLHLAVDAGNLQCVQQLIKWGADPHLRAPKSKAAWSELTPLELAKARRKKTLIAALESAPRNGSQAAPQPQKKSVDKVPGISRLWKSLEALLAERFPSVGQTLNAGATKQQISQLVRGTKIRLNKDILESLSLHNGQLSDPGLLETGGGAAFRMLTSDEMLQEWSVWQDLANSGDFDDLEATPSDEVRGNWWSEKWLPIASNGLGDCLCLDYAPTKVGKRGQVIMVWHESGERSVCFASLAHLLAEIIDQWNLRASS